MNDVNPLFFDLALILMVAGVVTIIFKALKQPLVLGYIVAGMLTGPYITFIPTATNLENVEFWGDIGVVFLLFGLGLEFNFKKLKKVGGAGFMTACSEVLMMFCMGMILGKILGWGTIASLFLGGMLSISSTSIIIKAFDDLGLKNKKFTHLVFGALVVEDLVAILLLVLLPALAVSNTFDGGMLAEKMLSLSLFILLWFTGGIFLIPSVYKKLKNMLTDETLIVVSLGLCLMMVVMTMKAGISQALGAFVMGSILSGTIQNEKIIKLTKPIKDFFGSIFFVSVGMLVDPRIVIEYWPQVLLITVTIIIAKPISAIIGLLFSGQTLRIALQSGLCLCQIGEFSFIIASLGKNLGVIEAYLYPIIVTVSILTTFITPYWIRLGDPLYHLIYDHVKPQWRTVIERLGTGRKTLDREGEWNKLLKSYFLRLFIYTGWLLFVGVFFSQFVIPQFTRHFGGSFYSKLTLFALHILAMSPFLYGLLRRKDSDGAFDRIWADRKFARGPLLFMMIFKYVIAVIAIAIVVGEYLTHSTGVILIICTLVILVVIVSAKTKRYYNKIENQFLTNLNSEGGRKGLTMPRELADEIHMDFCDVGTNSYLAGRTISQVHKEKNTGAVIIRIHRGGEIIDLPEKDELLYPMDSLQILGTDKQVQDYRLLSEDKEVTSVQAHSDDMDLLQLTLGEHSVLIGNQANITLVRSKYGVLIIGVEKAQSNTYIRPTSAITFEQGDTIWVVGKKERVKLLN
ncbi:MAG: cation:proton antiporter [Bacteroidales bacterium]